MHARARPPHISNKVSDKSVDSLYSMDRYMFYMNYFDFDVWAFCFFFRSLNTLPYNSITSFSTRPVDFSPDRRWLFLAFIRSLFLVKWRRMGGFHSNEFTASFQLQTPPFGVFRSESNVAQSIRCKFWIASPSYFRFVSTWNQHNSDNCSAIRLLISF